MTLPCVCELTAGGQKPPATAPATVRVDQQRRTQDRASSELPKGAPGPLRSQRRRSGQDGHPARCTGQLRPLAQTKTSQQIEHTRTSRILLRRGAATAPCGKNWRSFDFVPPHTHPCENRFSTSPSPPRGTTLRMTAVLFLRCGAARLGRPPTLGH